MLERSAIQIVQFEYNFASANANVVLTDIKHLLEPLGYSLGKLTFSGVDFNYDVHWNNFDAATNFLAVHQSSMEFLNLQNGMIKFKRGST